MSPTSSLISPTRSKQLLLHAAFAVMTLLSGSYWAIQENDRTDLPQLRPTPRSIRPIHDDPRVVSDDQLAMVLQKVRPRFEESPVKVNFIDHALRMWGPRASFDDGSLSGPQMLAILVSHPHFSKACGESAPALLERSPFGVRVRTQEGRSSVSHEDHLMGTLAECGTPLSAPLVTAQGPGTVHEMLLHALRSFRLNQKEYEWTTLAAAFYADRGTGWCSSEGQFLDFNRLAQRLMRQDQPEGVCYGQHRIYTLTMLLRVDEQMREEGNEDNLISTSSRDAICDYLGGITSRLYGTQSQLGFWDGNWPDHAMPIPDPTTDARSRRILATGHALEWWAMAPESLHPPRETVIRAAQWLCVTIEAMEPREIEANFTFLTHAARALALWRGHFPHEFESKHPHAASVASLVQ